MSAQQQTHTHMYVPAKHFLAKRYQQTGHEVVGCMSCSSMPGGGGEATSKQMFLQQSKNIYTHTQQPHALKYVCIKQMALRKIANQLFSAAVARSHS